LLLQLAAQTIRTQKFCAWWLEKVAGGATFAALLQLSSDVSEIGGRPSEKRRTAVTRRSYSNVPVTEAIDEQML
jgi:hypothetical protein